jgi:hypothetical protein
MTSTVLIALVAWLLSWPAPLPPSRAPAMAKATFERLAHLEGRWIGHSTRGWTETVNYQVIAGGSAVVETSFDAHPGETMLTIFHLDGDRLLLTHYCVAGNQPRLVASTFDNGGKTVTFTFLDSTNLPSRDRGHMDKAVFTFVDDDHMTSRWTWYQDGREQWLEEIVAARQKPTAVR